MLTKVEMIKNLKELGINKGDTVLVHSSFKSLGEIVGGAETVVSAFLDIIGEDGTLIFPTLCQEDWEHVYENWHLDAKSDVGYLTNYFRKLPGVMRSNQATHSVAAKGKHAKWLTATHGESGLRYGIFGDTPFSSDSPWDKVYALNAKMVFIGVGLRKCTLRHFVEYYYIDAMLKALENDRDYAEIKSKIWHYDRWNDAGLWITVDSEGLEETLDAQGKMCYIQCGDAKLSMVKAVDFADEAFKGLENQEYSVLKFVREERKKEILSWLSEMSQKGFVFKAPDFGGSVQ